MSAADKAAAAAAKKPKIGTCACPECGFTDAEIRTDKNNHAYRYCPDCYAQYFTRGEPARERRLRGLAVVADRRAIPSVTVPEPVAVLPRTGPARAESAPRAVTVTAPAPAAIAAAAVNAKRFGLLIEG